MSALSFAHRIEKKSQNFFRDKKIMTETILSNRLCISINNGRYRGNIFLLDDMVDGNLIMRGEFENTWI